MDRVWNVRHGCVVVLDVGKTLAKLTMWSPERRLIERRDYRNKLVMSDGYPALDVGGIETWLAETLQAFTRLGDIAAIVPVGHGAAACLIDDDGLCLAPLDYEAEPPSDVRMRHQSLRDPFLLTGSPLLPSGLNLAVQLLWLETIVPDKACRGRIVTWPQYWAWRLCGVAATEVTSLGCHTDLWLPDDGRPSPMAVSQGWAERLAPLHQAGDVFGPVTEEWHDRCALPHDCVVLCGLHDSNAALLAMRGYPEVGGRECTILSTGTWFIAMRSVAADAEVDLAALRENRDCLVNVDVSGRPVPSARFMGGREVELIEEVGTCPVALEDMKYELVRSGEIMIKSGTFVLPTFQKGVGPFPRNVGRWNRQKTVRSARQTCNGGALSRIDGECFARFVRVQGNCGHRRALCRRSGFYASAGGAAPQSANLHFRCEQLSGIRYAAADRFRTSTTRRAYARGTP